MGKIQCSVQTVTLGPAPSVSTQGSLLSSTALWKVVLKTARQPERHYGTNLFRADPKGQAGTYGVCTGQVLTILLVTSGNMLQQQDDSNLHGLGGFPAFW